MPKPFVYQWSDEELRLATGNGGVNYVQHQLKLSSAYLGVTVRCLNFSDFELAIDLYLSKKKKKNLQLTCSSELN